VESVLNLRLLVAAEGLTVMVIVAGDELDAEVTVDAMVILLTVPLEEELAELSSLLPPAAELQLSIVKDSSDKAVKPMRPELIHFIWNTFE